MKTPLVLIGGGGHCRSVIDVIESQNKFSIKGVVDDCCCGSILGYPVLGGDAILPKIFPQIPYAFITVGQIKSPLTRVRIYKQLVNLGYQIPILVSPFARISKHAVMGPGSIAMHGSIVIAESKIGSNVIINNQALVDHSCIIGDNCHISTGARLNGEVIVGENCFIGSGAIVRQGVHIGAGSFVAMGSVVTEDLSPNTIYKGSANIPGKQSFVRKD